jgi:tetratricopeptide (TPR) repeat protein
MRGNSRSVWLVLTAAGALASGCMANRPPGPVMAVSRPEAQQLPGETRRSFRHALQQLSRHDQAGDWSERGCRAVAERFIQLDEAARTATGRHLAPALYNAGLSYQRCGLHELAQRQFERAADAAPQSHRARAQLVLYKYEQDGDLDRAIEQLDRLVHRARFQNVEALVSLAALQMRRAQQRATHQRGVDLEQARKNLQRALAIHDRYMPAYNQLALYYLELARSASSSRAASSDHSSVLRVAWTTRRRLNRQQLELAMLVAEQAIRKNPRYAPIHNTAGLIQVELGNLNAAVRGFAKARSLDPKFVEAHLNYAAVNLSFRGFEAAERAYRDALDLAANNYEAHLGLALALRGQIRNPSQEHLIQAAQRHLSRAKRIAPQRPETYYNEAILTEGFKAKASETRAKPLLRQAHRLYGEFMARAEGQAAYAEAIQRAVQRRQDIEQTLRFMNGA